MKRTILSLIILLCLIGVFLMIGFPKLDNFTSQRIQDKKLDVLKLPFDISNSNKTTIKCENNTLKPTTVTITLFSDKGEALVNQTRTV